MSAHVLPKSISYTIFFSLMVLTAATVAVAFVNLGSLNFPVAIGIAITKATLVVLFFRHVLYSSRMTKMVVGISIFFLVTIDWIRWNEAMFLFLPIDAVLFFLGERRRQQYARVRVAMIVLISLLCAVGVLRQPLWIPALTAFLPMALIAFDLPHRAGRAGTLGAAPATSAPPAGG